MSNKTTMRLFMAMLAILTLTMAGCANLFGSDDDDDDDGDSAAPTLTEWEVISEDSSGLGSISERTATYNGVQETQRLVVGTHYDDVEFTNDAVWYLGGAVFIGNNAQDPDDATGNTLTIEEGTTIRGNTSAGDPGVLIITRGSDIEAVGTADDPITLTSANPIGERASGDWGGLIINGYARVQGNYAEGEGDTGEYGGGATPDDDDNSGTIRYVRVQFAGTLFSPDNELNGIVLQGVGSGTTIEYVQVHKNADDGIEWFGGSAQVKYYVGTGNEDDSADGDDGWNGSLQHAILQHYPATGTGSLIEADGDADDVFPASTAIFANITAIGSSETGIGLRFKSDANYDMYNSVIDVQANDDTPGYVDAGGATIDYFGTLVVGGTPSDDSDNADLETPNNGNELRESGSGIEDAVAVLTDDVWSADFDVAPTIGDVEVADVPAADPAGNTLDDTDYIGAYDGSNAWWEGWTEFPAN